MRKRSKRLRDNSLLRFWLFLSWITGLLILLSVFVPQGEAVQHFDEALRLSRPEQPVSAPTFRLPDLKGKMVALEDFRGKIVFLNFWATWCPPCRAEMPAMEKLFQRMQGKDFVMLAVDFQEERDQVQGFMKQFRLHFPALLDTDGTVAAAYGIRGLPSTYILDRAGKIVAGVVGSRTWDSQESYAFFEQLVNTPAAEARRTP